MKNDSINVFLGNYDYYLEKTTEVELEDGNYKSKTEIAKEKKLEREERRKNKALRKERENLESEIANFEEKLSTIDNKLADSATYNDFNLANNLFKNVKPLQILSMSFTNLGWN